MQKLLAELKRLLPHVSFEAGEAFFWSPGTNKITYKPGKAKGNQYKWALLHESAHALLAHQDYKYDIELLLLEVEAWEKAKSIAKDLGLTIEEDPIQDCLDTYRDWLHQRSTCPRCSTASLQVSPREYRCHNCSADWNVSASRFCRPYRISGQQTKKSPEVIQATFSVKVL